MGRRITAAHAGRPAVGGRPGPAITGMGLADGVLAVDERGPNRDLLAQLAEAAAQGQARARVQAVPPDSRREDPLGRSRRSSPPCGSPRTGCEPPSSAVPDGVTEREIQNTFEQLGHRRGRTSRVPPSRGSARGIALGQVPAG